MRIEVNFYGPSETQGSRFVTTGNAGRVKQPRDFGKEIRDQAVDVAIEYIEQKLRSGRVDRSDCFVLQVTRHGDSRPDVYSVWIG